MRTSERVWLLVPMAAITALVAIRCVPSDACLRNSDCGSAELCIEGVCAEPAEGGADAGTDAAEIDADAGPDAADASDASDAQDDADAADLGDAGDAGDDAAAADAGDASAG